MRAFIVCAVLALLTASAQANNNKNWGNNKPRYEATGTVLADNKGVGFDGKPYTWTADAADQNKVDIVSNVQRAGGKMQWRLLGKAADGPTVGSQSLYSVSWLYGAVVTAELDPATNNLSVNLISNKVTPVRANRPLVLSRDVIISYQAWWRSRKVEILVKPLIKIVITQPWLKPLAPGQLGEFADYLVVKVTLLSVPDGPLTGDLGLTYVPPLKEQLKAAKIIPDVIWNVAPIKGLTVVASFDNGAVTFKNGELLALADVATAPNLAITGARPWDKFVLFVVDPDSPEPANPIYRSWLHGLWYDIPSDGDLTKAKAVLSTTWEPPTGGVAGAGPHRYTFVLYKQPWRWFPFKEITVPDDDALKPAVLGKWNLNKVAWQKRLGTAIDATWFLAQNP